MSTRTCRLLTMLTIGAALIAAPATHATAATPARLLSAVWTGSCQLTVSGAGIDTGSGSIEVRNGGVLIGSKRWTGVGPTGLFTGQVNTSQCHNGAVYSYQVYDGGQSEEGWNSQPLPPDTVTPLATEWLEQGGPSGYLGYPTESITATADHTGSFLPFTGRSIYWSTASGAHLIYGDIFTTWQSLGSEDSLLGFPIGDEATSPVAGGRYQQFQNGTILWQQGHGQAFAVQGSIKAKWAALGHESGYLGYPVTNETTTPDGIGRYNHFQGGSIYWTPRTSAHEIHGSIRNRWAALGWERSALGYPTTDQQSLGGGAASQSFQHGYITLTASGTTSVHLL